MIKTATVRARIDPKLKKNAEKILHRLGLTHTQYINLAFKQLEMQHGIPFDLHIPNDETIKAMEEAEKSDSLQTFDSADALFDSYGIKKHAKN
jgi:DNA-damage-inducible protein J